MEEITSAELAGGVGVGFSGHIRGFNADVEARLERMLMQVGRWVEKETGAFMGHIKMSVTVDGEGITLNLTDLEVGVEHHDSLRPSSKTDFNFMSAVLDVDKGELEHAMVYAMEDSGVDFDIDEHECSCGHEHDHGRHDHGCSHGHHHDRGHRCSCGHHHEHG